MIQPLQPKKLMQLCKKIYGRHIKWGSHAWLITVLRPLYGPFHKIYPWIPKGANLLDIGCGTGSFLLLADYFCHLSAATGYDLNKKSIALANTVNTNKHINFKLGDKPPPTAVASATVITLIDLLHHLKPVEQTALVEYLAQHMSPGASLIVKDLDSKPVWRALANRLTDAISTRSRVNYLAMNELSTLLKTKSFRIEHHQALPKHVWGHYLLIATFKPD